jgi:hypothetical protein
MDTKNAPPLRHTKDTEPTLRGRLGNAWLVDMAAVSRRRGMVNDPRAAVTLPAWIASAAYAHPIWSHYLFLCVALRDVPGVPPARIHLAGATHKVMVYALDPASQPAVDDFPRMLQPVNFTGQFQAADDASAEVRVQQAVQDVIDGTLNPDTDARRQWVARFSASNLKDGALDPDFIAVTGGGGMVAQGMGAANVRNVQQIVETAATLRADESKPQ